MAEYDFFNCAALYPACLIWVALKPAFFIWATDTNPVSFNCLAVYPAFFKSLAVYIPDWRSVLAPYPAFLKVLASNKALPLLFTKVLISLAPNPAWISA